MRSYENLIGKKFQRLTVLELLPHPKGRRLWKCLCDCGNEKIVSTAALNSKQCGSCGCLQIETTGNRFRKHGKYRTPEYRLLKDAKKRAKEFNREYNIELEDIIIPDICPILLIPIQSKIGNGSGKCSGNSPSVDRVDSSRGYIKGNIRVISLNANRLKQNSTIEQLERIIMYMKGEI